MTKLVFLVKSIKAAVKSEEKIYVVQFKSSRRSHPVSPEMTSLLLKEEDGHMGDPVLL